MRDVEGVIDFAGSGVVHMLGGGIGLLMGKSIKRREARFFGPDELNRKTGLKNHTPISQLNEDAFRPNDAAWMTLGCFLLWFGW